jgi:UDPglucose 6-dehydrogenase
MGLDNRIGRKFLHPGPGYGGSCFPKDTRAIVSIARQAGVGSKVVEAAIEVNEAQIGRMMEKIQAAAGGDLKGRKIAVLGLAFKPNTSDARESPAVRIVREIQGRGGAVRAFDPAAEVEAKSLVPGLETAPDAYAAAAGSDVLVIATEWNQFRNLDWGRMKATMRQPVVVDLRNVYEPASMKELGFRYTSVGR